MKVHYRRPITDKNIEVISEKVENASNFVRQSGTIDKIISPICAVINILSVPIVPIVLFQNTKYSRLFDDLTALPVFSNYVNSVVSAVNRLHLSRTNNTILTLFASILIPVVICFVLAWILRLCIHKKPVSPMKGKTDKSLRAKILCRQIKSLSSARPKGTRGLWLIISIVLLLGGFIFYFIRTGLLNVDAAKKLSSSAMVPLSGLGLSCMFAFLIPSISHIAISELCFFKPKYDVLKLHKDAMAFRLSLDINTIIEEAIKNQSFYMNYQPIYSFEEKKFRSAEALIRLDSEIYGPINPFTMIEAAEKSGQICAITDIVINKTCQFVSSERFKQSGVSYIDINLSVLDCVSEKRVRDIIAIVDSYNLPHNCINFEITESASASSKEDFWNNIGLLSSEGFTVAMDDFGTGYSSLSRVIYDEFKTIKLDRSLIADDSDSSKRTLLIDIVNMLKHLDKKILMEGVETASQLKLVKELGIDYVQGYYYSKPLPSEDFIDFVCLK